MRNGFFGSLIILVATAGLVLSGEPQSSGPAPRLVAPFAPTRIAPTRAPTPSLAPTFAQSVAQPDAPLITPPLEVSVAPPAGAYTSNSVQGSPEPENGTGGRFWGGAEFLLWWIKGGNVPPLVTTGPPASGGVLGAPGTTTLFGGGLDYRGRPGARFTIGSWLDCDRTKGIELSYFFLNGGPNTFGESSSGAAGSAVLSRPFFNVVSGLQDAQVVAFPGLAGGSIRVSSNSGLQGATPSFFCNLCCQSTCCHRYRLDLFAGPSWLQLNEDLVIAEQATDPTGTLITVVDRFETRNNFYGAQIGARAEWQWGSWFVNLRGTVALGDTHQEVRISGTTVITEPGAAPVVHQGGLLALPTNIGSYSRDMFSVVPMIGMNAGCQLTNNLRAFAGYNFLYWSNVVRPGDQIDFGINPTQLPSAAGPGTLVGPARPAFEFRDTSFWAHGISVGAEFRW